MLEIIHFDFTGKYFTVMFYILYGDPCKLSSKSA